MTCLLFRLAGWLPLLGLTAAVAAPAKALPLTPVPVPVVPAILDEITFNVESEGDKYKLDVIPTPTLLRIDDSTDGYSLIYDPATEHYTGLEHRNYTYWDFYWQAVKAAVENTKRYEARLKDLGTEGLSGYSPDPGSSAPAPASTAVVGTNSDTVSSPGTSASSDDSGYIWKPGTERKRIAGYDCVRWTGESVSGPPAEAWCYAGPLPLVEKALAQLRIVNEPMALVPVRTLVPPFVFEVNDSLGKGGVTPLAMAWGGDGEKSRFDLLGIKTREGKASLFMVPKLYVKTTLVTMDGIGDQKPEMGNSPTSSSAPQPLPRPTREP
jgi:hypothetical protein